MSVRISAAPSGWSFVKYDIGGKICGLQILIKIGQKHGALYIKT